jgi:hypothetical protein
MNKEKTIEQRLERYAISQKPLNGVESVANIDDSLDRHMPPTSKKSLFWIALASPLIALTAWLWLIVIACKES